MTGWAAHSSLSWFGGVGFLLDPLGDFGEVARAR